MAKILSQEEIDALLTSVSTGEEVSTEPLQLNKKISLYDFKHPNLISKEQMRFLENVHESVVRNFGVYLSAQLRMIVDIGLLAIDQIMYSEFVMSIAPPGAIYVGTIDSPYSNIVLEMNPQLTIFIVERMFGGKGNFINNVRPISVIEQRIVKRIIDRVAVEIEKSWAPVKEFNCIFDRFESNPEFVQIIPASEPVVVVSLEIKLHGATSLMNICYPYMWISNIISRPEVQNKIMFGTKSTTEQERTVIASNLDKTDVRLKAVLGKSRISIQEFLNLKTGDVLQLDTTVRDTIPVYTSQVHMYNAAIGESNKNYAIQISSVITREDNDEL
ncbi:MAG: flagellar motor switch protein FliM [FCB group bacterium]|nr:flagellar motor switch protein FliM [FCB group bacterium]